MRECPAVGPRLWRLTPIAAAILAGNLALHQLPSIPSSQWLVPAVLAMLLSAGCTYRVYIVAALVALFWTAHVANSRLEGQLSASEAGSDFSISGWIDAFPDVAPQRTAFSLRVVDAPAGVPGRVRLTWYDPPVALTPGMSLNLTARLRPPRGLRNPGGFDYERWLFLQGFGATGYVRDGAQAAVAPQSLANRWLVLRHRLAMRIAAAPIGANASALLTALALGERTAFGDTHWQVFRRTGTSHLVAISGMHIGLLAALSFWIVRIGVLRLPNAIAAYDLEIAAAASVGMACAYAALAGFALPTQRAVLMLMVALAVAAGRRSIDPFDGFAAALILVLAADPLASLTASFWLSFGAVAALLGLAAVRRTAVAGHRRLAKLAAFGRLQWCMSLALLPLVAVYFHEVSIVSPLVNLVAIPVFSLVLVPVTLLAAAALAIDESAVLLVRLAGTSADVIWGALAVVADRNWSAMTLPAVTHWHGVLAALAVALALPWHAAPGRRLAWVGLVPLFLAVRSVEVPGRAEVLVMDVGHGLAVIIATQRHRLLFDAGPVSRSGFDAGAELVVPVLVQRFGAQLDLLVVSHGDADHAGGAPAVLRAFPGAAVLRGSDVEGLPGSECRAGQSWEWDGVQFAVLHPPQPFAWQGNESSCVVKVSTGGQTLLLTGDIERRAEALLSVSPDIGADVVVVPHHGSATSSSPSFVAAVAPRVAVVSAAYANRWGFPRPDVTERWRRVGAEVVVTGQSGALEFSLGSGPIEVRRERRKRKRYWHSETPILPGDSTYSAL